MEKIKNLIKRILNILFDSRYEKFVIFALPCIAVMLSIMIIAPSIIDIVHLSKLDAESFTEEQIANTGFSVMPATDTVNRELQASPAATANVQQSPIPSTSPIPATEVKQVHLTCTSVQSDLYIFVRDINGYPVQGERFRLDVKYPGGQTGSYETNTDGSCYLVSLSPGSYSVTMQAKDGYSNPDAVSCNVSNTISYNKIEEIEDIVEIKDVAEVRDEIKINENEAPIEIIPEEISTIEQSQIIFSDSPVLDFNGYTTYTYTYETINGHLINADGTESDVVPIEENGILMFGLKFDSVTGSSYTVELFNADNTPVSDYLITATPVMQEQEEAGIGWQTRDGYVCYVENGGNLATGLKSIDGKLYYFDCYGRKANSVGIDVSFYNGTVNWQAVKNSGIDFVIIRVGGRGWSTGLLYDDSCFYNYINGAKTAGLKVGVYFYSTAVNPVEAIQEASLVLNRLNGTKLDYPVFIDMEYSGDYPMGRSDNLSMAERVVIALTFCKTVNNDGYQAGIYSSQSFLKNNLDFNSISPYCIWLASYTENNALPQYGNRYDIWQFTDRGHVPGVSGSCDINVIF